MRKIIFRGKSHLNNEWLFGDLEYQRSSKTALIHTYKEDGLYNGKRVVKEDTVGQFTGLHDKNGTPIYEGDILRYPAKDTFEEKNFVSFEVFWHNNDCAVNHVGWQMNRHHFHGSVCGTSDISTFLPKYTEKMVIIGNIHDNPELMK